MAVDRNPPDIDYLKLAEAQHYYTARGWEYREVPWLTSIEAVNETLPNGRVSYGTPQGELIGSAETGFIELLLQDIEVGRSCSISPCFRDEPTLDLLHQTYFMKLELFDPNASSASLASMIHDAQTYFNTHIPTHVISTGEQMFDIVDQENGIELGSYGKRTLSNGTTFLYGTGLALPRLDIVRKLHT